MNSSTQFDIVDLEVFDDGSYLDSITDVHHYKKDVLRDLMIVVIVDVVKDEEEQRFRIQTQTTEYGVGMCIYECAEDYDAAVAFISDYEDIERFEQEIIESVEGTAEAELNERLALA